MNESIGYAESSSYSVVTLEYINIYEKTLKALYLLSKIF